MTDVALIPQQGNENPEEKYLNRHVIKGVAAACAYRPDVWRDLGIELLGQGEIAELDVIKANNADDVMKCCSKMLSLWLQLQTEASWNQLIEALMQVKLKRIAKEIKKALKSPTEDEEKIVDTMQATKITPTQQQDQAETKQGDLQRKSNTSTASLLPTAKQQSKALVKFSKDWSIETAYYNMTSAVETILTASEFFQLRRTCIHKIRSLAGGLSDKLIPQILHTSSMNELLDVLAQSEYWNWFDTRLLEALTYASGSPEAIELLEHFKRIFYPRKISEFIDYKLIRPFKEFVTLKDKFDKDPSQLTVYELLEHKFKVEKEVLDIDEGELVLSCIKTGCVELTWQIPQELVYRAYTSMKRKHNELSSLAVKSLVCEVADEYAGLPILWRGQEVGEVGPIEPLPEHVRQESYSLPQGFHWVTLTTKDVAEVEKFLIICGNSETSVAYTVNYIFMHPNTKHDWQFGIRASNFKLIGVVLAFPVSIRFGGVSITCIYPFIVLVNLPKYSNDQIWYMLIKELVRRAHLCNINHLVFNMPTCNIFKPINATLIWTYIYDHSTSRQLPSSPRTPGWRKMTSKDVPSALALINKWSSQFEFTRTFDSEEEFAHTFLCPTGPSNKHMYVVTYIVENETNNITDLVSFKLDNDVPYVIADVTTVASTKSSVKQLLIDTLVCARENYDATGLLISQCNIEPDVLSSLSFHHSGGHINCYIYNYRYHEVPEAKSWYREY